MSAVKLTTHRVEKPWGRMALWPGFDDPAPGSAPVGEIWFEAPPGADPDLMVKYLFTSERLSIQVHPDDAAAHVRGLPRGKDEAWVILAAEPGATIALGTIRPLSADELRSAACDGSIEALMHWQPVKAGDVIYSRAGVVHAIGGGLTLVEVQQNVDVTYRLYDYGRPRALHLDDGVAVAKAEPFAIEDSAQWISPERSILVQGGKFVLERWTGRQKRLPLLGGQPGWFIPLAGAGEIGGQPWHAGECWIVGGAEAITLGDDSDALFAYPGGSAAAT